MILVIFRYIFAYNPRVNPFDDKKESSQENARNSTLKWTPNPIDDKTVGWLRKIFRRVDREAWEEAMEQVKSAGFFCPFVLDHLSLSEHSNIHVVYILTSVSWRYF